VPFSSILLESAVGITVLGTVLLFGTMGCFMTAGKVREKLEHELHAIACAPIPAPGDPRFKGWDPDKIIPPGRWGDFVLLPGGPRGRVRLSNTPASERGTNAGSA
jgi:hypothetical protein